ncbi:MAG TPA: dienelactone hydrolase family protein [Gemmatimonadaceae bacterium]|jgi:carboxymethylenebutenolidase
MNAQTAAKAFGLAAMVAATSCTSNQVVPGTDAHDHPMPASTTSVAAAPENLQLPGDAAGALARLSASPRHGEWAMIRSGGGDSVKAWVVYPERSTKAPVVIVVHEIFGLSSWIRGVADQLAADGFIAIAPDLLTMKNLPDGPDSVLAPLATAAIRTLDPAWVQKQLDAVAEFGMSLPSAQRKYGIVGFCWGGGISFAHAVHAPMLGAAVVYYGVSPQTTDLASVRAPVLGLYGGSDARVDATIPPADSAMRAMGKTYTYNVYPGAGHGFLRQQTGMDGANMAAARAAWPATIAWFRKYLGS